MKMQATELQSPIVPVTSLQGMALSHMNRFFGLRIDPHPELLEQSYALRYEAYCLDEQFLDPAVYPDKIETDEFDDRSIHLAVMHKQNHLLTATARIIRTAGDLCSLPMYRYCEVDSQVHRRLNRCRVGEVSRLIASRSAFAACSASQARPDRASSQERLSAVLVLYKNIYQTSRREGITHLVAAMELSLQRLFRKFRFPFHQIGPQTDYYGPVAPFLLDLQELDDVLFEEAPLLFAEFSRNLEPWALPEEMYDFGDFFGRRRVSRPENAIAA